MKYLITKAAELITGLDHVETIEIHFSLPYAHTGYTHDSLVVFFKEDENGNERESQMYLFSITRQQWEIYDPFGDE